MAAWLLLPLVLAGAGLYSAQAQNTYTQLPDSYKRGVDLALEQLQSHAVVHHHFRFLKSLQMSSIESGFGVSYLYHHFLLKPTTCAKGTTDSNAQSCPFRNDRPLMDCAVCYKTANDQIEPSPMPYVHCIQKPRLTRDMKETRTEHCRKMSYNSGAPTLLAVVTGRKKK
uniref:Retinoic acid receptor responder protein 2 n=1 Tax=Mola mola TaxID=94237 RepID=A0A3Q3VSA6_MOLML